MTNPMFISVLIIHGQFFCFKMGDNFLLIPLLFNVKLNELPTELRKFQCVNVSDGDRLVDSFQSLWFSIDSQKGEKLLSKKLLTLFLKGNLPGIMQHTYQYFYNMRQNMHVVYIDYLLIMILAIFYLMLPVRIREH